MLIDRKFDRHIVGALFLLIAAFFAFAAYVSLLNWWVVILGGVFSLASAAAFMGPPPYVNQLSITDEGVTRRFGPKLRAKKEEKVSWDALTRVTIETTDGGPAAEDFYFMLWGPDGKSGVIVGNGLAVEHRLLDQLQKRLPGLDNRVVAVAAGCTENNSFLIWQRADGNSARREL